MNLITTIHESEVYPGAKNVDSTGFKERRASRAVVFDDMARVALLKVGNHGYYKLPGGGIDEGEDIRGALERELMEEIGSTAKVTEELGEIVEYRDRYELKQVSYCFIAKQYGDIKAPDFTDDEIADGFEMVWAQDINDAIKLIESSQTDEYAGRFIVVRDLALLKLARKKMSKVN